jgi:histidinol-phosphatase
VFTHVNGLFYCYSLYQYSEKTMNEILEFALLLARAAEAEIMSRFQTCAVNWKADGSEVTDADRHAEAVMRELIAKHTPGAAVLGEEYGGSQTDPMAPLWLLDPVDGTASFAVGLPVFGTVIGYMENGEPEVGVMHLPAMKETVYAARGSGCWAIAGQAAPRRVHVSGVTGLQEAYVSSTSVNSRSWNGGEPMRKLSNVIRSARQFRFIGDVVQHALVAQGRIDAGIDPFVHPWDIAALVPCIEEAGGTVTDLDGHREGVVWQPNFLSSSNAQLHHEILSALSAPDSPAI